MTRRIAINSHSTGKYRTEVINNRPHLVTEMVSIVCNTVMNGLFYSAPVIINSYQQLNNLLAPAGHPKVGGEHVSAYHHMAINANHIGGTIRSPRNVDGRIFNELVFDVETAEKDERGKSILNKIRAGEPIGVSTGLNAKVSDVGGNFEGVDYAGSVSEIEFDHVAMLLNEPPAGNTFTVNKDVLICNINQDKPDKAINQEAPTMDKKILIMAIIANAMNTYTESDRSVLEALDEVALVNAVTNKLTQAKPTVEQSQKVLEDAGLTINSADFDKDGYAYFVSNKSEFDKFLTDKETVKTEMIDQIVANSKMTKEQVSAMPQDGIESLAQSLIPAQDFSVQGQPLTNNDRSGATGEVDYS